MSAISISPPNSVILVMDSSVGQVPMTMTDKLVSATNSCLAVGCRSEHDGPTEIHMAASDEVMPVDELVFDGELDTPARKLSVLTTNNAEVISVPLSTNRTRVRVFANDMMEPDRLFVVFDRPKA